jgi:hypothetical protein
MVYSRDKKLSTHRPDDTERCASRLLNTQRCLVCNTGHDDGRILPKNLIDHRPRCGHIVKRIQLRLARDLVAVLHVVDQLCRDLVLRDGVVRKESCAPVRVEDRGVPLRKTVNVRRQGDLLDLCTVRDQELLGLLQRGGCPCPSLGPNNSLQDGELCPLDLEVSRRRRIVGKGERISEKVKVVNGAGV